MTVSKQHTAVLLYPRSSSQKLPRTINVKTHLLDVNGFDWSVETAETLDDELESCVALRYTNLKNADTAVWYCEATLFYTILNADARKSLYWSEIVRFTPQRNHYTKTIMLSEDFVEDKGFWNEENNCEIFISIQPFGEKGHKFYKRTTIDWNQNLENADCCVQVEGENFFVGKATLVRHSKYFDSVFFGSDGVDLTPFVLTDASKHDFRLFLNYIHRCDNAKISAETVLLFIQIAVRLQSEGILAKAEKFVVNSQFHLSMKIDLSETYQLPGLKDHCEHLLSNCCLPDINHIMATYNYESVWSEDIRKATVKRLHAIANEQHQQLQSISNGFNPFQQQQQVNYGPPPGLFQNAPPNLMNNNNPSPPIRPAPAPPRQRRAPVRRRAPPAAAPGPPSIMLQHMHPPPPGGFPPQQQGMAPMMQQQPPQQQQQNNWNPMPILQPQQPSSLLHPPTYQQPQPAPYQPNQPPANQPQLAPNLAPPFAPLPVPAPKRRRVNRAAAQQPNPNRP
ncbi:hypothetical protein PRIPAC_89282 [Pristionchus pacificus]|nr:hypothetical protein PRIPAC_89282 [Pristionchus pacificus]